MSHPFNCENLRHFAKIVKLQKTHTKQTIHVRIKIYKDNKLKILVLITANIEIRASYCYSNIILTNIRWFSTKWDWLIDSWRHNVLMWLSIIYLLITLKYQSKIILLLGLTSLSTHFRTVPTCNRWYDNHFIELSQWYILATGQSVFALNYPLYVGHNKGASTTNLKS